jgi:hypothetical protein
MNELTETLKQEALNKHLAFEIQQVCLYLGDAEAKAVGHLWLYQKEDLLLLHEDDTHLARAKWGKITVFDGAPSEVRIYRPGPWEAALNAVYLKAVATKVKQEREATVL